MSALTDNRPPDGGRMLDQEARILFAHARAVARTIVARAEAEGFVREPSLNAEVYELYLLQDAEEALEWLDQRTASEVTRTNNDEQ
jgi:hypothetical protein